MINLLWVIIRLSLIWLKSIKFLKVFNIKLETKKKKKIILFKNLSIILLLPLLYGLQDKASLFIYYWPLDWWRLVNAPKKKKKVNIFCISFEDHTLVKILLNWFLTKILKYEIFDKILTLTRNNASNNTAIEYLNNYLLLLSHGYKSNCSRHFDD